MTRTASQREPVIAAPHPPLTQYYPDEAERCAFVRDLFDRTAPDYERIERLLALGTGGWYRRQALLRAGLAPGMRMLDVGVGTGILLRQALLVLGDSGSATGMDPSSGMMALAEGLPGAVLAGGRAERIPFRDASFDFVSMGYALRHIGHLSSAFSELHRVLRPGGRLCILEITQPEGRVATALLKTYIRGMVPAVARLTGARRDSALLWRYYWDTIEACEPPQRILDALTAAGFAAPRRYVDSPMLGFLSEYHAVKPTRPRMDRS